MDQMASFVGAIKSWNPTKGWGFIECDGTFQLYGTDIFLLKSQITTGQCPNKGEQVVFQIRAGNGRAPEATNVRLIQSQSASAPSLPVPTSPYNAAVPTGQYVGTVKSWNPDKGWGHIECADTQRMYGKDIFLMRSALGGIQQVSRNQQVRFTVTMGQKGHEAANVQVLTGGFVGAQPHPAASPPGNGSASAKTGQSFCGSVKSFNPEKGWGHIECHATHQTYGKDVFFMRSSLGEQAVQAGDKVMFTVIQGLKGVQADSVTVLPAGIFSSTTEQGVTFSGIVKGFNAEKGWGHIECADTRAYFNKDIFLHRNHLGGHLPQVGEDIQFNVGLNPNGQPEAVNINRGSYAAARLIGNARSSPY